MPGEEEIKHLVFQLCSSVQGTTFQHVPPCGQSEELLVVVVSALEQRPDVV